MKFLTAGGLIAALASTCQAYGPWPIPTNYSSGDCVVWISPSVQVTYNGAALSTGCGTFNATPSSGMNISSSQVVSTAWARASNTIFNQNFIPWKFHPRFSDFEPTKSNSTGTVTQISLVQNCSDAVGFYRAQDGKVDESYSLTMTEAGQVTITAESAYGIAHGLTTFTQLFYAYSGGGAYSPYAPVSAVDSPLFPHRGMNMDVSRDYYPPHDIARQIDALAYNKMNRLHIHITDSQSWPLVIPSIPELAGKGAYCQDCMYTPEDVRKLQTYGALVGVEVFLETDMPGHTGSIALSHPELIAAWNVQPDWDAVASEPPSGTLKLGNNSGVPQFLQKMYADILPRVAPYTSYFHTGGDEVNANAYKYDDSIGNTNDSAKIQPYINAFVLRNHAQVFAQGLTPIVWEEMLLTWNVSLDSRVLVQSWQSDANVALITGKGYQAIAGNYEYWYLDCGQGQWLDFYPDIAANFWPFNDYCSPRKNWKLIYSYDPLQGVPANETHLVLGGEVSIWSESTDPINLDRMVWPRAAAAAEVLWSGAKDPATGQNRSQITASPRLAEMRERLVARGVMAEPVHMVFCTQNGTQCAEVNA